MADLPGAIGIGVFGMLFANAMGPTLLILLGVLVTLCNNLLSYSFRDRLCLFLEPAVGGIVGPRRRLSAQFGWR
jgi:hypothetical protein